jgi:hypothetical protein
MFMSELRVKLNPTNVGYYCGSFMCCIVFGIAPIVFSSYLMNYLPIPNIWYYWIAGGAITIGVYLFFYAILRARPSMIICSPSELRINYKNRKPLKIPRSNMRKVRIKYRWNTSDNQDFYKIKVKLKKGGTKRILIRDTPWRKKYRKYRRLKKYIKRHYPH